MNKTLRLSNLKTRTVLNAKISMFVTCVEAAIYVLLYNLHDCTFNKHNHSGIEKLIIVKLHLQLNDNHVAFNLEWKIAAYTSPYKFGTRRCNLCLTEKYFIIREDP